MKKFVPLCIAGLLICFAGFSAGFSGDMESPANTTQINVPIEITFTAAVDHQDQFNKITVDALFDTPSGKTYKVPAFWAGGRMWKVRYAPAEIGVHRYRTECTMSSDQGLHGVHGAVTVEPYSGDNPLYAHGAIRIAEDRRHFAHADGTPFFWLGDTWWMGLCKRLHWPADFKRLADDRKAKDFTVIQIVAGLYPDMAAFDPRGANEAAFPWEQDYSRIRPEYFDKADERLFYLVSQGFVPCIVGAWGYHLPWMGTDRIKQHWRYLVARYGALPVVWCAAGEGTMPFYESKRKKEDAQLQKDGWTEVIRYIHATDPFGRLITIHPSRSARETVTDASVLDFDMHQTGHQPEQAVGQVANRIYEAYKAQPIMPVISGESSYDGLDLTEWGRGVLSSDASRQMFWACVMNNGAAGSTYGANGIWQVNRRGEPYGPSPHGRSWGSIPWDEAMQRPGSNHVGLAKRFFEQYPWYRFEPMMETVKWADNAVQADSQIAPMAAGIGDQIRVIYSVLPHAVFVRQLKPDTDYSLSTFNPVTGEKNSQGIIRTDKDGRWRSPSADFGHDCVFVLERR